MDSRIWWLLGAVVAVVLFVALMSPREVSETASVPTTTNSPAPPPKSPPPAPQVITPPPSDSVPAPSTPPKQ
jgi:hypothetical protein